MMALKSLGEYSAEQRFTLPNLSMQFGLRIFQVALDWNEFP
jgi:hypothetical protein